ncbi:MAG: hypothetical protein DRJ01_10395 [Bacteroidetes bacterium]|nr:MAG: hypothetical protein DRJ01_10395 [Bacteroidota bacterium]
MKKYLNQLIEDMHKAAENLPAKPYLEISEDEECLRGVMEYESIKPKPMQEWFGIDKANFPPAEKLSKDELKLMVGEILKLWNAYNFDAVLPENLPDDIAYKVLVDNFDKPVEWISEGTVGIEFCDYDEDNCPFPGYCNLCKEFSEENITDNKNDFDNNQEDILPSKKEIEEFIVNQKKENIKNIIENHKINKNNIPGIYNYCDRWCEHCPFTSRCTNYSLGKELQLENNDISNKEFWENMSALSKATFELITESAQKHGMNLNEETDEFIIDIKQKEHPLYKSADEYAENTHNWLKKNSLLIEKTVSQMTGNNKKNIVTLHDAIEIIQWYCFFIPVKLSRALLDYDADAQDTEMAYDNNGSAKIALIAVDRSIQAISVLIAKLEKEQDELLNLLSTLFKIKKLTEKTFPNARSFVRPGFDE